MVCYRRNFVPGGIFFFTVTLEDRASDLLVAHVGSLREAFRQARLKYPLEIQAIVVLPDHLHTIWVLPEGETDFPLRWRCVKSLFTQAIRREGIRLARRDGEGFILWQRRFWEHTIRDETDFSHHCNYIHFNLVKHGCVASPADWPFSSIHGFIRSGVLAADWGTGMVDPRGPRVHGMLGE